MIKVPIKKGYKWVCNCDKNGLNNIFPNGEYSPIKPLGMNTALTRGKCAVCGSSSYITEFDLKKNMIR